MNKTFNLYNFKGSKAVGSDLVTPWIDDLLDKKNAVETEGSSVILSYPVEKILTPAEDITLVKPQDKTSGVHIVPLFNKADDKLSTVSPVKPELDPEREISYFTFVSGNSFYALPSLNINEIIRYKTPVNIFSKKAGHLGIILYRNKMVPVYDFSIIVNGAIDVKYLSKYIVICIYENKFFGLSVSEIKNITGIKNKNLISPSTFKFRNSNNIISDVFENSEGKFYSVISVESIFTYLTS